MGVSLGDGDDHGPDPMIADYLADTRNVLARISRTQITTMIGYLTRLRDTKHGRLFIIGNGGGQGHASHAACDFTKIARIPSYAWGDNASQLTAYANDNSWESGIACWLDDHHCGKSDAILVFSVGGASDTVSANLKWAMSWAKDGPVILGIVGAAGGEVARYSAASIVIPSFSTPIIEGLQAVIWHGLVGELAQ
jgi:D-sedoheptulose 7-phosphate isomerase